MIFEIEVGLSRSFPALSPISIRRTRAAEVFLLLRRYNEYIQRENEKSEKGSAGGRTEMRQKDGKKIIRRPAGDDWF